MSHREMEVEGDEKKVFNEGDEPDGLIFSKLFKFKKNYDQTDFTASQCLDITKVIIKLTAPQHLVNLPTEEIYL